MSEQLFNTIHSVRNNPTLKAYLTWLRTQIYFALDKRTQIKVRSMSTSLVEKLYLEKTGKVERVFLTNDEHFPVIKLIGNEAILDEVNPEIIQATLLQLQCARTASLIDRSSYDDRKGISQ